MKMFALVSQIAITMLTSIFLCVALGYWVDNRFDTHFLIFFIFLGVAGGYRAVYSLVQRFIDAEKEKDQSKNNKI